CCAMRRSRRPGSFSPGWPPPSPAGSPGWSCASSPKPPRNQPPPPIPPSDVMSAEPAHDTNWRRAALAAALAALLFCAYLLTFSGVPVSDDERHIIDTTDSMAVRGNLLLNQTSYLQPIQVTLVEPGQPLLSVPLYWLGFHTPWFV